MYVSTHISICTLTADDWSFLTHLMMTPCSVNREPLFFQLGRLIDSGWEWGTRNLNTWDGFVMRGGEMMAGKEYIHAKEVL